MPKISITPDCGNSPRKGFIKDFHVAIANGDVETLSTMLPDELLWNWVGKETVEGKPAFLAAVRKSALWKVRELILDTLITHGAEASASGTAKPSKGAAVAFSCLYKFSGAGGFRIVEIKSFFIAI
jgi:hypothetical protein